MVVKVAQEKTKFVGDAHYYKYNRLSVRVADNRRLALDQYGVSKILHHLLAAHNERIYYDD